MTAREKYISFIQEKNIYDIFNDIKDLPYTNKYKLLQSLLYDKNQNQIVSIKDLNIALSYYHTNYILANRFSTKTCRSILKGLIKLVKQNGII